MAGRNALREVTVSLSLAEQVSMNQAKFSLRSEVLMAKAASATSAAAAISSSTCRHASPAT